MSILNSGQRAVIRADTGISPFIIDNVVTAYDQLLADNIDGNDGYNHHIAVSLMHLDLPIPIPDDERPTAVDKMKTICIRAIADQRHWSFRRTAKWLEEATK